MNRILIITMLSSLGLFALAYYFFLKEKQEEKQEEITEEANFSGAISGASMFLGAVLLLAVVLIGGALALAIFGIGWTGKKIAQDPDKSIDRTVRLTEAYSNVRRR